MAAKKKVHTLTASLLRQYDLGQYGPCFDEFELFRALFPRGARITAENGWRAIRAGLNLSFARRLLSPAQQERAPTPTCGPECSVCRRQMEVFIAVLNERVGQLKKLEAHRRARARARARDRRSA